MQAASWLRAHLSRAVVPGLNAIPGFDAVVCFSMRQQWFTHVRLLVAHLTRSRQAFSAVASHPGS
jgi:hypothetical protein